MVLTGLSSPDSDATAISQPAVSGSFSQLPSYGDCVAADKDAAIVVTFLRCGTDKLPRPGQGEAARELPCTKQARCRSFIALGPLCVQKRCQCFPLSTRNQNIELKNPVVRMVAATVESGELSLCFPKIAASKKCSCLCACNVIRLVPQFGIPAQKAKKFGICPQA
jgi:hypothetical protein